MTTTPMLDIHMNAPRSNRPLRTMFIITSMPVGGAETLLVNLVRRFDRDRIHPLLCCLKEKGPLGEELSEEIPVFDHLIGHKFDVGVAGRLKRLMHRKRIDAVVTVGAGDKMFWGRLAARRCRVPVVLSALHSTGWPDGVGRMNRWLTPITDGFIAVARSHARFLVDFERFPAEKVFTIPNGIDTGRFRFQVSAREAWRAKLGIPSTAPVVGIVAALRPEKNHSLFLRAAHRTLQDVRDAHFIIAGDGPERGQLTQLSQQLGVQNQVHFLGSVSDIPGILSALDVFTLTSKNEASPVSILEAMACERPVVAPDVGSIAESVIHERTGLLVREGDLVGVAREWCRLLSEELTRRAFGQAARQHVIANASVDSMTSGYTHLIESLFRSKVKSQTGDSPTMSIFDPARLQSPGTTSETI